MLTKQNIADLATEYQRRRNDRLADVNNPEKISPLPDIDTDTMFKPYLRGLSFGWLFAALAMKRLIAKDPQDHETVVQYLEYEIRAMQEWKERRHAYLVTDISNIPLWWKTLGKVEVSIRVIEEWQTMIARGHLS